MDGREKMYETVVERADVGTLQAMLDMKKIDNYRMVRMFGENSQELKPYEAAVGRLLTMDDAVVISPLTEDEVWKIIKEAEDNKELEAYQRQKTQDGIRNYNLHYSSDDPICAETIDYALSNSVDTSSGFTCDYDKLIRNVICDNVTEIVRWRWNTEEPYLEIQTTVDEYIGSGMIRNNMAIREMKTRDVVVILERDESEDGSGFLIVTAYPDITERAKTAIPTGSDIRQYIHETEAYKNGDAAQRKILDDKVMRGITH